MNFKVDDLQMLRAASDVFCDFLKESNVCDESIFDSRLVLSELAGNVLKYSGESARIDCGIIDGKIEVEVTSHTSFCPPEKTVLPDVYAEHGRGLFLVDKVSEKRFITDGGGIRVVVRTVYNKQKN